MNTLGSSVGVNTLGFSVGVNTLGSSVGVNTLGSRVNTLGIHYASEVDKYRPSAHFYRPLSITKPTKLTSTVPRLDVTLSTS